MYQKIVKKYNKMFSVRLLLQVMDIYSINCFCFKNVFNMHYITFEKIEHKNIMKAL